MTGTNLILIGVALVAILAAVGAFAVAFRRSRAEADWTERVGPETRAADRSMAGVRVEPIPVARPAEPAQAPEPEEAPEPAAEEPEREPEPVAVSVVEAQRVVEVAPEEAGVSRRQFFNRALGATFGVWSAGMGLGILAFVWPRLQGGFGSDVDAGSVGEVEDLIFLADGSVQPLFVPEAKAYVVPSPETLSEQFTDQGLVVGGMMALFQTCVHLGCRVPWCASSQGFECPCHGSRYNSIGEYFSGPAPRNLDRFVVEDREGRFVIVTGQIFESPRAPIPSVEYPQGPTCISATAVETEEAEA